MSFFGYPVLWLVFKAMPSRKRKEQKLTLPPQVEQSLGGFQAVPRELELSCRVALLQFSHMASMHLCCWVAFLASKSTVQPEWLQGYLPSVAAFILSTQQFQPSVRTPPMIGQDYHHPNHPTNHPNQQFQPSKPTVQSSQVTSAQAAILRPGLQAGCRSTGPRPTASPCPRRRRGSRWSSR